MAAPAAPPPPAPPPPPAVPLAEAAPPPPPPPVVEVKDARKKPMTMNAWGRLGTYIQGKSDPKQKKQLASLIAEHTQSWSPSLATDPVEQALRSMIQAKQKRAQPSTKKPARSKGGNVIDLMAVLKKSLQGGLPQRR